MRFGLMVVAVAALVSAAPVSAATIVQTTSNSAAGPIGRVDAFDQRLGTLQKVTLETSAREGREVGFRFTQPPGTSGNYNLTYDLNGQVIVSLSRVEKGNAFAELGRVAVAGSGTRSAPPSDGNQFFILPFSGTGMATFDLDPTLFLSDQRDLFLQNNDPGFRNGSLDTQFSSDVPFELQRYSSQCDGFRFGDEACNNVVYRLTYEYAALAGRCQSQIPGL